ncbi:MAG TPA: type II secretion system protein [Candidatus Acidoferrum sp.]|nr:type II secretion system protein [Candidatus Acidoferrum sp.]
MHRRNNKGFTLIEVAVTITVLAISLSVVMGSMSSIYSRRMQTCAVDINTMIAKCRVNTVSRSSEAWLRIEENADGITVVYGEGDEDVEVVLAGKSMLRGSFVDSLGGTHELDTEELYIAFERGTGKMKTVAAAAAISGEDTTIPGYVTEIIISCAGDSRTITLVPETGKHFLALTMSEAGYTGEDDI